LAFQIEFKVSDEERARLRTLEDEFKANMDGAAQYSLSKITDALFAQRDAMHADVGAGKDVSTIRLASRDSLAATYRAKAEAFRLKNVELTHKQIVPLCKTIIDRFEMDVQSFMANSEQSERELATVYSLEFKHTRLYKLAAAIALRYCGPFWMPGENSIAYPSSLLKGLVEF